MLSHQATEVQNPYEIALAPLGIMYQWRWCDEKSKNFTTPVLHPCSPPNDKSFNLPASLETIMILVICLTFLQDKVALAI